MKHRMHKIVKTVSLFLICSFIFTAYCEIANGQGQVSKDDAVATYNKHRQTFLSKQTEATKTFKEKKEDLEKDIQFTSDEIARQNDNNISLDSVIAKKEFQTNFLERIQLGVSTILFPLVGFILILPSFMSGSIYILLYIFLAITIINVFIFLYRKKEAFFAKYKVVLILLLIVLISSIASPVFAEDVNKQEQIMNQLTAVEKVLTLSDHERFIDILEKREENPVSLPELQSGDPLFKVFPEVKIDTPEYWYTLAALYTHEGKNGKALNALKQLVHVARFSNSADHHEMIISGIRYLIQHNQQELINGTVESLTETNMDTSTFLALANLLQENGLNVSEEKILGLAIEHAVSVEELFQLSKFLIKSGEIEKGSESIEKAIDKVSSFEEILLIANFAISTNKDTVSKKLIDKVLLTSVNLGELFQVVDLFQKNGRKEEAVLLVSEMIGRSSLNSVEGINQLIYLIDGALQRGFLVQATKATELLYSSFGDDATQYRFETKNILKAATGLPNQDNITLSQFYGLINEDQDLLDKAEDVYMQSALVSLTNILKSKGYKLPASLNDYFLLGRVWAKENKSEMLWRLDNVYSIIEQQALKDQRLVFDKQLEEKKKELEKIREEKQLLQKITSEKLQQSSSTTKKLILQGLSTVATIVFILTAIISCVVISFRYSRELSLGKTFGFFSKFNETMGWLYVMTVVSIIPGMLSIVVAQLMQIFQQNQENTRRISNAFLLRSENHNCGSESGKLEEV